LHHAANKQQLAHRYDGATEVRTDALWERIEPLLPVVQRRYWYAVRSRIPDRRALTGILAQDGHLGNGLPLAHTLTAANRNDLTQLLELIDRIAPIGPHGKFRPAVLLATVPTTAAATARSYAPGSASSAG
jgi:hypothetical protein